MLAFGLSGSTAALAQGDLYADLALEIAPPIPAQLPPGATGELEIEITNLGPDDAGFSLPDEFPLYAGSSLQAQRPDGGFDIYFLPATGVEQSCILIPTILEPRPGGLPQIGYGAYFPPIAAGESLSCTLRYLIDPMVMGRPFTIAWRARTFTEVDPNPDNDSFQLVFNVGLPAPPTPVPVMAFWSLLLLSWCVVFAGSIAARRHS